MLLNNLKKGNNGQTKQKIIISLPPSTITIEAD
jgi:hypothetical protein